VLNSIAHCVEQCVASERDKNAHEYRVPENALTYFLWSAAISALFYNSDPQEKQI
jgi:hypothetical protein